MRAFVDLFSRIDTTTKTTEKVQALANYLNQASDDDKLWTLALFSGRTPKRIVNTTQLKLWAAECAGIPFWLFEECYHVVGDLSETIAGLVPSGASAHQRSLSEWMLALRQHLKADEAAKKAFITSAWSGFTQEERFVFNKLTSGAFRMGVSQKLLIKALSKHCGLDENQLAHRLMGNWDPEHISFAELILTTHNDHSKPYPFYLAYALEQATETLGSVAAWQIEHKWDGIRSQVIVRSGELFIWSRGEELVTQQYPELEVLTSILPDGTVLDGELLPFKNERPLPFADMQTRISRKKVSAKLMQQTPVILMAYDLLEWHGEDVRNRPLHERRNLLESLVQNVQMPAPLRISPLVQHPTWEDITAERERSRSLGSEGLMLKRAASIYDVGRKKGDWWKWKVDPMTVDAVMLYAQGGSGRRANLFTDYTFAVWNDEGKLVPFAKAYSGLTDKEILEVDAWIKRNTIEKFGPVRSVHPELVFELGFEGIQKSTRHKSGVAVRFPRILRWRKDKPAAEADTLSNLLSLIEQQPNIS